MRRKGSKNKTYKERLLSYKAERGGEILKEISKKPLTKEQKKQIIRLIRGK